MTTTAPPRPRPAPKAAPPAAARLRRRAEQQLVRLHLQSDHPPAVTEAQRLVHELQVHQIELQMQNAELLEARSRTESLLEKYTDLYDFSPVGYFSLGADGRIQLANLTGASLLGRPRTELIGRLLGPQLQTGQQAALRSFLDQVFTHDARQAGEFNLGPAGRPLRTVHLEAQCLPDRQSCRVVMRDVTERKLAVDRLRDSETRYRRLFEAAHDGVLLLDPDTRRITDANPFMTKLLGYPHAELVGKELFEIGLLKDEAASQEMFRQLRRSREVRYEDLPLESRDGRRQEVEVVANLYQEGERPVIQCNIRDITQRKLAEDILRRNEALFAALIEQAPVGVYVVDARFRLMRVNPKAQPLFAGIRPLLDRDFGEIVHRLWSPLVADGALARFRHTLQTGAPYHSPEFAERRRDTGVDEVYEWQIQRITLPAGEYGVVCFFSNITERKKGELVQRRLAAMLAANREANRDIARRRVVEASLRKSELAQRALLKASGLLQAQLRHLTRDIITAQEAERKKISRELHDDVMQTLVGINTALGALGKRATIDPATLRRNIAQTHRLVKNALLTVHRFARNLRPAVLDDFGLIPALQAYSRELAARKKFHICLTAPEDLPALDNSKQTVLFRVAQEALANVARHARATRVWLRIAQIAGVVRIDIHDNGKSFRVRAVLAPGKNKRLGLLGMRERVEMVGGRLTITSSPRHGTLVRAEIPVEPEKKT